MQYPHHSVLIVDHRQAMYERIKADLLCIGLGERVVHATSATIALTLLETNTFSICLLNYALQGKGSADDVLRVTGHEDTGTPTIVLLKESNITEQYRALNNGAKDYIQERDLSARMLERVIKTVLRREATLAMFDKQTALLRNILSVAAVGIVLTTLDQIILTNEMLSLLSGYTQDALLRMSPDRLFLDPAVMLALRQWFTHGDDVLAVLQNDVQLRNQDGREVWVRVHPNTVLVEERMLLLSITDVTEMRRTRQQIAMREQRFRKIVDYSYAIIVTTDAAGWIDYTSPAIERVLGYTQQDTNQAIHILSVDSLIHPDERTPAMKALKLLLSGKRRRSHARRCRVRHKDGSWRWLEATLTSYFDDDGGLHLVIHARDITDMVIARDDTLERMRFANSLLDIATALSVESDYDSIYAQMLSAVGNIFDYNRACIAVIEGDYAQIVAQTGYAEPCATQRLQQQIVVSQHASLQAMIWTRQALRSGEALTQFACDELACSYLAAPIIIGDVVMGFIMLESTAYEAYSYRDERRLTEFSTQVAVALNKLQMLDEARYVAAVQERRQIARDLHDSVTQTLFSATMTAQALPLLKQRSPHDLDAGIDQLIEQTQRAHAEMRSLLFELRPVTLMQAELTNLLNNLAHGLRSRSAAAIHIEIQAPQMQLPPVVQENLYRITQEALNNAIKHAQANYITLTVSGIHNNLDVTISDDGRGFLTDTVPAGRIGHKIMQERATAAGITMTINSVLGYGTTISLFWMQ